MMLSWNWQKDYSFLTTSLSIKLAYVEDISNVGNFCGFFPTIAVQIFELVSYHPMERQLFREEKDNSVRFQALTLLRIMHCRTTTHAYSRLGPKLSEAHCTQGPMEHQGAERVYSLCPLRTCQLQMGLHLDLTASPLHQSPEQQFKLYHFKLEAQQIINYLECLLISSSISGRSLLCQSELEPWPRARHGPCLFGRYMCTCWGNSITGALPASSSQFQA